MTFEETMARLKELGTDQNIKVYKRHGAGDNLFGVSFADLRSLHKQIKTDHTLAGKLWNTGNTDARTLALLVADPQKITVEQAENWADDISYYVLADMLAEFISYTKFAKGIMTKWIDSDKEFIRQSGYSLLASMLKNGRGITDQECRDFLKSIEKEIQSSPNRARHAMNMALIAIGIYCRPLRGEAIETARRIGKIEVDHGETSCRTPNAVEYILKAEKREKAKSRKA